MDNQMISKKDYDFTCKRCNKIHSYNSNDWIITGQKIKNKIQISCKNRCKNKGGEING